MILRKSEKQGAGTRYEANRLALELHVMCFLGCLSCVERQSNLCADLVAVRLGFSPIAGQHFFDGVDSLRGHPPIVLIRRGDEGENKLFFTMRKVSAHQPLTVPSDEADLVHLRQAQLMLNPVDDPSHHGDHGIGGFRVMRGGHCRDGQSINRHQRGGLELSPLIHGLERLLESCSRRFAGSGICKLKLDIGGLCKDLCLHRPTPFVRARLGCESFTLYLIGSCRLASEVGQVADLSYDDYDIDAADP